MASEDHLYCMTLPGFWMDVGQPRDFLAGTELYLRHLQELHKADKLDISASGSVLKTTGEGIVGPVLIVSTSNALYS